MRRFVAAAVVAAVTLLPLPAGALTSSTSGGFDASGHVETIVDGGSEGLAATIQPDGRIVVAGATLVNRLPTKVLLARYLADGQLDTGFDSDGVVITPLGNFVHANAVALQPDGEIVVAGQYTNATWDSVNFRYSSNDTGVFVARFLTNGSLDGSFATNGIWQSLLGPQDDALESVTVDGQGRIVAAGSATGGVQCTPQTTGWCYPDVLLVRLTSAGQPDPGFGGGTGRVVDSIGPTDDMAHALLVDPGGRIVVAGETRISGGEIDLAVARYLTDGSLDPSFAHSGHGTYLPGSFTVGTALAIRPGGSLLVGVSGTGASFVAGLLADGTWDPSWDGQVFWGGRPKAISVQGDGSVLMGADGFAVARYRPDGYLDSRFAGDGDAATQFHPEATQGYGTETVGGMAVRSDGSIVLAGRAEWLPSLSQPFQDSIALARFPDQTVPAAPTGVVANAGDRQVSLTWTAPADSGGSPVTSYVASVSSAEGIYPVTGIAGTTTTITGLHNGTAYTFTVAATNTGGTGPFSAPSATVTPAYPTGPVSPPPTTPKPVYGYWMVGAKGDVYAFGDAQVHGKAAVGQATAVDLEPTPSGNGYWILDNLGRVYLGGDATGFGGVGPGQLAAGEQATSLSATKTGAGYWIFTNRGRVLPFGDAAFFGDVHNLNLAGPVIDSIPTPSGQGYYMVASDGGIFTFGDAHFRGSMGGQHLNAPVQSLVPNRSGLGYWLVASDGGIFAFGDAAFRGSMGGTRLNRPMTGMVRSGDGYLMVGEDGGIFDFSGTANGFKGSLGANPPADPITSVAVLESTR